jgi:hypothetical protein
MPRLAAATRRDTATTDTDTNAGLCWVLLAMLLTVDWPVICGRGGPAGAVATAPAEQIAERRRASMER